MNAGLRNIKKELNKLKQILLRFERVLIKGDGRNDATLINELDHMLDDALKIVYLERHNQVFQQTNYQVHFEMRSFATKQNITDHGNQYQ